MDIGNQYLIGVVYSNRQNSPMTTYSEVKQGPCLTSDFEKDAFCRNQWFSNQIIVLPEVVMQKQR